jgi:hypothetical protein
VDAWTERFDHIDDHFMGRHGLTKQAIQDWIPVDSDKPKGDMESPLDLSPGKESQDGSSDRSSSGPPNRNSPEASGATGASPVHMRNVDENPQSGPKRSRSSSDDDSRPMKHQKTAAPRETLIFCVRYYYTTVRMIPH